ncbi:MAG: hypothetical protein WAL59_06495 [Roseiarcus sp.]
MSETMNRRAALGALASVPALAILPAASALALAPAASPVHPDAALFAMQAAIAAADRQLEAALDALNPAEEAYFAKEPDRPVTPGADFSSEEQQAVDAMAAVMRKRNGAPSPAWAAYYQAVQDREREVERLQAECGVTAAQEREDAAHEAINSVRDDLIDVQATTLAGLIFTARYAATHDSDEWDEDVMASIVEDLLAMADDPEGFADV